MRLRLKSANPSSFGFIWTVAGLLAGAALGRRIRVRPTSLGTATRDLLLLTALGLFVLSRIVLLFPLSEAAGRLRQWWMDWVLIAAAGVWWAMDRTRLPIILRVGGIYVVAFGVGACVARLDGSSDCTSRWGSRYCFVS